jgi:hypothetical protein
MMEIQIRGGTIFDAFASSLIIAGTTALFGCGLDAVVLGRIAGPGHCVL